MSDDSPSTYGLLKQLRKDVRDGFKKNDEGHEKIGNRLRSLEEKEAGRRGREGIVNKLVMIVVGLLSAVLGAKFGGKV